MDITCEAPPIIPSECHEVLFEIPIGTDGTLKAYPKLSVDLWNENVVKMPNSASHLHPVTKEKIWDIVVKSLEVIPNSFDALRKVILSYNDYDSDNNSFIGLKNYIENDLLAEENKHFFEVLLPNIISLALSLPEEITKPVPLLSKGSAKSLSLSQKQIGVLLANAFLCTFSNRKTIGDKCGAGDYPDINFNRLFMRKDIPHYRQKFKGIFNYFERITRKEPDGVVTFTRAKPDLFDFESCDKTLPLLKMDLNGAIETATNHLQVDFADKYIGGMIFTKGCVQEEIRFILCPELIVARLFTAVLGDSDSLIVTGVEQYNAGQGFGHSFKVLGPFQDETPRDDFKRKKCQLVAIDALSFNRRIPDQYKTRNMLREIQKAYSGYLPTEGTKSPFTPVATGNWGCGVFRGNPVLKSLLQIIAAGAAGREIKYFAFGNKSLVKEVGALYNSLRMKNVKIGELTKILLSCSNEKPILNAKDFSRFIKTRVEKIN